MTERTKLRNQIQVGLFLGISYLVRMFWGPFGGRRSWPDPWWAVPAIFLTGAGMFFYLAWTKWVAYREKYPRLRDPQ